LSDLKNALKSGLVPLEGQTAEELEKEWPLLAEFMRNQHWDKLPDARGVFVNEN